MRGPESQDGRRRPSQHGRHQMPLGRAMTPRGTRRASGRTHARLGHARGPQPRYDGERAEPRVVAHSTATFRALAEARGLIRSGAALDARMAPWAHGPRQLR